MKIPKSIRIGGVEYAVNMVDWLANGSQLAYGHIDFDKCLIEISETAAVNHEKRCMVMWHEILHGIVEHTGIEIENEERVVDVFSRGIYQVLQDNGRRLFDIQNEEGQQ